MSRSLLHLASRGRSLAAGLALVLGMAVALPCSNAEHHVGTTVQHSQIHRELLPVEHALPSSIRQAPMPAGTQYLPRQLRWVF